MKKIIIIILIFFITYILYTFFSTNYYLYNTNLSDKIDGDYLCINKKGEMTLFCSKLERDNFGSLKNYIIVYTSTDFGKSWIYKNTVKDINCSMVLKFNNTEDIFIYGLDLNGEKYIVHYKEKEISRIKINYLEGLFETDERLYIVKKDTFEIFNSDLEKLEIMRKACPFQYRILKIDSVFYSLNKNLLYENEIKYELKKEYSGFVFDGDSYIYLFGENEHPQIDRFNIFSKKIENIKTFDKYQFVSLFNIYNGSLLYGFFSKDIGSNKELILSDDSGKSWRNIDIGMNYYEGHCFYNGNMYILMRNYALNHKICKIPIEILE